MPAASVWGAGLGDRAARMIGEGSRGAGAREGLAEDDERVEGGALAAQVVDDPDRVEACRDVGPGDDLPHGEARPLEAEPADQVAVQVDLDEAARGHLRGDVRDL